MTDFPKWTTDEYNGMPYQLIGKSGLRASCVGLGTWKYGYPETGDGSRVGEKEAFQIFDRAVELGVTFWDTANRYNNGSGNSERVIGKWFESNPEKRRDIVLATKMFGGMDGFTPNHSRLSRMNILESVYASLKRLHTDYIDLLYFHAFDAETPIEESLEAVEDLVRRDLVRYFAVSNFTVPQLSMYLSVIAQKSTRCRIVAVENQYDIINGQSSSYPDVLNFTASLGISYIAWSPLARGLLTNRYLDINNIGSGDRLFDEKSTDVYLNEPLQTKVKKLAGLASIWGIELNQLALSYMLTMKGMGPVIPSSSSVKQLESNAAAARLILNADQKRLIEEVIA